MDDWAKFWRKHLKESLLVFALGFLSTGFFCTNCWGDFGKHWDYFIATGCFWVILWKGNEWVAGLKFKRFNWESNPTGRLMIGVLAHVLYTFLASFTIDQVLTFIYQGSFRALNISEAFSQNFTAIIVALVISLFMMARAFLFNWRELAIQNEKLKTESMASRFASLKAQVNPHFLFNSLNVLSGLVYQDADLSARFIKKLAEVYRYVLDQQEQELVPISEELEFVEAIVFLQQIRFGENLKVTVNIPADSAYLIPPLALQMLIENAIKHNVISAASPLKIEMEVIDDYFVISNTLQPKTVMGESLGLGLENIRKRYGFLTNKRVHVIKGDGKFVVKLPTIEEE